VGWKTKPRGGGGVISIMETNTITTTTEPRPVRPCHQKNYALAHDPARIERALELRRQGWSVYRIRNELKCAVALLTGWLQEAGLMEGAHAPAVGGSAPQEDPPELSAQVVAAFARLSSLRLVGRELKLSTARVARMLDAAHVYRPHTQGRPKGCAQAPRLPGVGRHHQPRAMPKPGCAPTPGINKQSDGVLSQCHDRAVLANVRPGEPRTCGCGSVLQDETKTHCWRCKGQ
jgi:hypothetical protein